MRIETEAFLMGHQDIHSSKSGKDFEMYADGTHKKLVWNGKGFTLKNK